MAVCFIDKKDQNSLTKVNLKNHDFVLFCSDRNGEKYVFTEYLGRIGEYHIHDGIFDSIINGNQLNFLEGFVEINVSKEVGRNIFCTKKIMDLDYRLFINFRSAYYASRTIDNKLELKVGSQTLIVDVTIHDFAENLLSAKEKSNACFLKCSISDKKIVDDKREFNSMIFMDSVMIVDILPFDGELLHMFLFKNGTRLEAKGNDVLKHSVSRFGDITFEK